MAAVLAHDFYREYARREAKLWPLGSGPRCPPGEEKVRLPGMGVTEFYRPEGGVFARGLPHPNMNDSKGARICFGTSQNPLMQPAYQNEVRFTRCSLFPLGRRDHDLEDPACLRSRLLPESSDRGQQEAAARFSARISPRIHRVPVELPLFPTALPLRYDRTTPRMRGRPVAGTSGTQLDAEAREVAVRRWHNAVRLGS